MTRHYAEPREWMEHVDVSACERTAGIWLWWWDRLLGGCLPSSLQLASRALLLPSGWLREAPGTCRADQSAILWPAFPPNLLESFVGDSVMANSPGKAFPANLEGGFLGSSMNVRAMVSLGCWWATAVTPPSKAWLLALGWLGIFLGCLLSYRLYLLFLLLTLQPSLFKTPVSVILNRKLVCSHVFVFLLDSKTLPKAAAQP